MKNDLINYNVIHYYPNRTALEFINIGVVVYNNEYFSFKLIEEEIDHVSCSFIHKKALKGTIDYPKRIFQKCKSINDFNNKTMYFDDFSISKPMLSKVFGDYKNELDSLYFDFVSYKFDKPTVQHDKREEIKNLSKRIVKTKFQRYVTYNENEHFDFVLNIQKKSNIQPYPTIIGSLFNSADTSRVFKLLIAPDSNVETGLYGYINTEEDLVRRHDQAGKTLSVIKDKLKFSAANFSNEESIENSIERLVS